MKQEEIIHIILAALILSLVIGFDSLISADIQGLGTSILFSIIILTVGIGSKKLAARQLDADVEHRIWNLSRLSFRPGSHFKKPVPFGVILPLIVTALSLGFIKLMTVMTYETTALKRRASKRFGAFSFTEMTDTHNAFIGATGIVSILILSFISYWFSPLESLARVAAFYAFFNMLPFSTLDGTQIYFGSRLTWYVLGIITLIFAIYALILP